MSGECRGNVKSWLILIDLVLQKRTLLFVFGVTPLAGVWIERPMMSDIRDLRVVTPLAEGTGYPNCTVPDKNSLQMPYTK